MIRTMLALAALAAAFALVAPTATAGTYGERLVAEGNDFFHAGNFFRASESYRCAVLEEPADGQKKLAFGHSLFALGNYAYAAYSFRRGVRYLGYPEDLRVEVAALFPSRLSYERAVRDVRRYASYYPNDPHALTVIAYTAYFGGDRIEAESAARKLLSADNRDSFAAYILRRVEADSFGTATTLMPTPDSLPASQPQPGQRGAAGLIQPITPINSDGVPGGRRATGSAEGGAVVLRPPSTDPAGSRGRWVKPAPPPLELPPGERAGAAETLSQDEMTPAFAK